jgi:hypothetical protein
MFASLPFVENILPIPVIKHFKRMNKKINEIGVFEVLYP